MGRRSLHFDGRNENIKYSNINQSTSSVDGEGGWLAGGPTSTSGGGDGGGDSGGSGGGGGSGRGGGGGGSGSAGGNVEGEGG